MTLLSKQTRDVDESKYSMNIAATNMTNECDTNVINYMNSKKFNIQFSLDNIGLSIFSLNISSLNKHKEELLCFLSTLSLKFDIIILSETRKNYSDFFHYSFPDYRIFSDQMISFLIKMTMPPKSEFSGRSQNIL